MPLNYINESNVSILSLINTIKYGSANHPHYLALGKIYQ